MNRVNNIVSVGLGELAVSANPKETLKTYGLGSCIALVVYDRTRKLGGLLHVVYPESSVNRVRAGEQPEYFVDTGVPLLFRKMNITQTTNRRDILIRLAGGSNMMDEGGRFNIGKRNHLAVKKELWKLGYGVYGEDTGGNISRTVWLEIDTGVLVVANGSRCWEI